jgi:DNA-binding protein HU-beta
MTKVELIEAMANEGGIPKTLATKAMHAFLRGMQTGLVRDGELALRGFGTFKIKNTEPRTGRNPKTGEAIEIPARQVVKFKASKDLLGENG